MAAKWFNAEDFSDNAVALRDDQVAGKVKLASSVLLIWEVCNALRYNPEMGANEVRRALSHLLDLQMVLTEPNPDWMDGAIDEAFQRGLTLYDSCYTSLAAHLRALLYSADDSLLSRMQEEWARHISTYEG